ncbi:MULTISPECIES: aspartate aminotransferase family protein [Acetobacter]|uniref:Acetylornithine aminotransferase n=1 Tax=Acetobacter pomorum DM001 TaxID=945681 RepID=F1YTC9_9PROT|nr:MULTISPECIES: aspartate aminotransferase family protein [Acetobacter]ATI11669.1 acetylornithine transaminase [Acetobacter pomorum]AXC25996.1 aspartate aminotransferase family protein [Acetobacter sp. JWB]EGE48153.1 Acetylornithine aminotransferase [Acetobacter pomorum DM001]KAA8427331.1 aspartate aminotransferase family protein [Acetobacter pomorum]KAA8432561.1 aspartate aminotransferase family protein [Acetobacter pomorum]
MISALMPTYKRADLAFERGEGSWLQTSDGRRFLDFAAGIATCSIGHAHPKMVEAISTQAAKVMHVSNLFQIPQAEKLARRLVEHSFADSVFFCNSGAEANEGMVKMARRAQMMAGHPERTDIICMDGAFHGRTLAMLSATGNPKYLEGFGEPVKGFLHVPFNDIEAVKAAITPNTAAVMLEPIQGESGIKVASPEYLQALRALCDETGVLLVLDEVQCGVGRTGRLFAHEWAGIKPDIISTAKGLGGGFPIGAILTTETIAKAMTPGTHGTTFGGNPLACAAGNAVLDVILAPGFLDQVCARAALLDELLDSLVADAPDIFAQRRGLGLLIGLRCVPAVGDVQGAAQDAGLLCVTAGDNVLRLVPPLTVSEEECRQAVALLAQAVSTIRKNHNNKTVLEPTA